MRFIHIADIHLGASPERTASWAKERANEIWDTFYRVLAKVEETGVDLLLITGDLFHRQPLKRELKEVNYRFSQLTRARVVIIAGNHDYIGPQSYYRDFEWSPNVVFFKKNHISYVYLASQKAYIYGMSYDQYEIQESLYDAIKPMKRLKTGEPVPADSIHILLAHGGDARHIPMNLESMRRAGFDYIAMGHIHKPWLDEDGRMAYAGALEPLDRSEEGPHGYIIGEIAGGETNITFVPFAKREYKTIMVPIQSDMSMQEIADRTEQAIAAGGRQHMYQIVFEGFKSADLEVQAHLLTRYGRVLSITDNAAPDFDYEQLYADNQDNIIGMYIKYVTEMDVSDSMKAKVLCYGMKALLRMQ